MSANREAALPSNSLRPVSPLRVPVDGGGGAELDAAGPSASPRFHEQAGLPSALQPAPTAAGAAGVHPHGTAAASGAARAGDQRGTGRAAAQGSTQDAVRHAEGPTGTGHVGEGPALVQAEDGAAGLPDTKRARLEQPAIAGASSALGADGAVHQHALQESDDSMPEIDSGPDDDVSVG